MQASKDNNTVRPGKNTHSRGRGFVAVAKLVFWLVFAFVLLGVGYVIGAVQILSPERLTPLVNKLANSALNADVNVGKVELTLRQSFPFLNLDVDDLSIASRDIRNMSVEARDTLPQWADTLLTTKRLHGGINLFKALNGTIDLKDLEICSPQVNVLVVNETLNNFSIMKPSAELDTTPAKVPDIRLNRFSITHPRPIRYADLAQDMSVTAQITAAEIVNSPAPDRYLPIYKVDFDCNLQSPLFEIIGRRDVPIGLNGIVEWSHEKPCEIGLVDFAFKVSELSGEISTHIDFTDRLTVRDFQFAFNPLAVRTILGMIPAGVARSNSIPRDIDTDAKLQLSGAITQPYILGNTALPYAEFALEMGDCRLSYEKIRLEKLALQLGVSLKGDNLDHAAVDIRRFTASGEGTRLDLAGTISHLGADPLFDGKVDGRIDIASLPTFITGKIPATIKGIVTADADIRARPSMLTRNNFHKLKVAGNVDIDKFYYLAYDTLTMYTFNRAKLHFGTNQGRGNDSGKYIDSLLTATVEVDTASILVSGLDIQTARIKLGVGARNTQANTDTTMVIPMGGKLDVGSFSLFSITDSAGVRIRNVEGSVSMQRYRNDTHLPLFNFDLGIGRISAGNNHTRFMVSQGRLRFNANKLAMDELSEPRRQMRHITDSIRRRHPDISPDSVYVLAREIRMRHRRHGHRVHTAMTSTDEEVIEWGASTALRRMLLDWNLDGQLRAGRARLFTPSFPIRNRVENLNITFNNDSLSLTDVMYKAGESDFLISGSVTNMKRAFTARHNPQPLKGRFDLRCNHIDVNEIANAFFTGAANKDVVIGDENTDEATMQRNLDSRVKENPDTVAPLLIPTNIDAELKIAANTVVYSDILLNNFTGTLLMYDGALNLHKLEASSQVGAVNLSALYAAPTPSDMHFGFGLKLSNFNVHHFLDLVPAVDSIMPVMRDFSGIINANVAATAPVDRGMNLVLPAMKAAIKIEGDSLVVMDKKTFKTVSKWLMFKDKKKNMIDHVSAEMLLENDELRVFPFMLTIDRYKLGIQGYNDLDLNFNYHIAVLKSPIPFRFGINISGCPEKYKVRLGRAHFNDSDNGARVQIVDTARVNLINQFENIFRRGVRKSRFATVDISNVPLAADIDLDADTLTAADSLYFRQQGLLPPDMPIPQQQ